MEIFSLAFSLFLVMNTIGSIPIFLSILAKYPVSKQRGIIIREMFFALLILLIFMFFGDDVLKFIGISQSTMGIGGGIILFIIGLGLIFPKRSEGLSGTERAEPFIVPLAVPLIAGPGAITTVMIYANQINNDLLMCGVIFLSWVPSITILLFATRLKKILGQKGLSAIQRFGGMLLCLIAVQMISSGSVDKIKEAFPAVLQSTAKA